MFGSNIYCVSKDKIKTKDCLLFFFFLLNNFEKVNTLKKKKKKMEGVGMVGSLNEFHSEKYVFYITSTNNIFLLFV